MSISSRPPTGDGGESDPQARSRLMSREQASRGSSKRSSRLATLIEQEPVEPDKPQGLSEKELERERQRLAREKEERAKRLQDELEQSLDTKDSVRLRRRRIAEVNTLKCCTFNHDHRHTVINSAQF